MFAQRAALAKNCSNCFLSFLVFPFLGPCFLRWDLVMLHTSTSGIHVTILYGNYYLHVYKQLPSILKHLTCVVVTYICGSHLSTCYGTTMFTCLPSSSHASGVSSMCTLTSPIHARGNQSAYDLKEVCTVILDARYVRGCGLNFLVDSFNDKTIDIWEGSVTTRRKFKLSIPIPWVLGYKRGRDIMEGDITEVRVYLSVNIVFMKTSHSHVMLFFEG